MQRLLHEIFHYRIAWPYLRASELQALYTSLMLKSIAISLVGIFIPIYLYELGNSLTAIFWFYFQFHLFRLFFDRTAAWLIAKYGANKVIALRYVFFILTLNMLVSIPLFNWPLWSIALMSAVHTSLFFTAFDHAFYQAKKTKNDGEQISSIAIIQSLAGALGPAIGGIIADVFGIEFTFIGTIIFLVAAFIAILLAGEGSKPIKLKKIAPGDYLKFKDSAPVAVAIGSAFILGQLIWPLFLGVNIFSDHPYAGVGIVMTIGQLMSIIVSWKIGKLINLGKAGEIIKFSSWGMWAVNITRLFVAVPLSAAIVNLFGNSIGGSALGISYAEGYFNKMASYKKAALHYNVVFGAYTHLIRLVIVATFIIVLNTYDQFTAFDLMFIISSGLVLLINNHNFKFR